MDFLNNPRFWEVVGAVILVFFAIPILYLFGMVGSAIFIGVKRPSDEPRDAIEDPVFGRLEWDHIGYWHGTTTFPATGGQIALVIDAADAGPTKQHHAFWDDVNRQFTGIHAAMDQSIREFTDTTEGQTWELEGIDLALDATDPTWTANFVHHDGDYSLSCHVEVSNGVIQSVSASD